MLKVEYVVQHDRHSRRTEALVHYAAVTWHISQDLSRYSSSAFHWHISATRDENGYNYCESNLTHDADPQMLQTILLLHFRQRREKLRHEKLEAAQRAEQQKWRTEIAKLKQQALEHLWHWPEGVEILLYRITYVTAVVSEDSDDLHVETESGWTSTDHLDQDGYIRMEAARNHSWGMVAFAREVKLDREIHRPIWERYRIGSVQKLPQTLREEISVSHPYVVCRQDPMLDEVSRLVHVESYYYDESPYTESVGYVPLSWVKTLVEQAATKSVTD